MAIPDKYKKIDDSFETGYENVSNKELMHRLKGIPAQSEQERIKAEMTRRLIDEIAEFSKSASQQTEKMIKLTQAIVWLTVILGILALMQVIFLLK